MSKSLEEVDPAVAYEAAALSMTTGQSPEEILQSMRSTGRSSIRMRTAHPVRSHLHSSDSDYYLQPGTDIVRPLDDLLR